MPKLIRHMELIINKSLVFVLRCVLLHSMRRFKRRMWKPSHVPLSLATTQDVVDCTHTHTQTNKEQAQTPKLDRQDIGDLIHVGLNQ